MHINCPHCHNGVEVVEEASLTEIDCPSCGSHFSLLSEDPDATLEGGYAHRMLGRFELINEVGVGAFGSVWRGKDLQLDRTVAVKIPRKGQLNNDESEQFFREARAAAQLKHPNIVPVHEIGKDGDTIYIVSEFVEGISLAGRTKAAPLSMRESAELCIKICRAIDHAHAKGVIHRDLKPDNIMLDAQGEPLVMDFGLAKREAGEVTMTVDGQILGTPAYMSPEQARGSAHDVDGRSDLYSVGVILFELLTGELPFRGNARMLIHQVINEDAPSPLKLNSNIDKDLATITLKCLEKDADQRFSTTGELADDLQRYLDGKPISARPIGRLERSWRWCKRKPALSSALALSTFLLIALAIGSTIFAIRQAALKQQAVLAKQDAKESARSSSEQLKILAGAFQSVDPSAGSKADMTARDVLNQALRSLEGSELNGLAKAELLASLAVSFRGVGGFDSAVLAAEGCHALRLAGLGAEHPLTLQAMQILSISYESVGRFDEAIGLGEKSLDLRTEKLGRDHLETLIAMNNLALSYDSAGRYKEALDLREKTLALRTEKLGPDHPDTLLALGNLANSYSSVGRSKKALELWEKTLALRTEKLGQDHPQTLISMNNLADAYTWAGRTTDAIKLWEKLVALRTTKLGSDHPHTLRSMFGLANSYCEARRYDKAIELGEKTLALQIAKLGPDHPQTLQSMQNLSLSYDSVGRKEDSLELDKKTLDLKSVKLGPDHPQTLQSMGNLAISYDQAGRTADSLELFAKTLELMTDKLGAEHPDTRASDQNLSIALQASKRKTGRLLSKCRFAEAEELLVAMSTHRGPHEKLIKNVPQGLHLALLAQGKWKRALSAIDEWIVQLKNATFPNPKLSAWATTSRAVCLLELGKVDEAEKAAEEALANDEISAANRHRAESVIAVCLAHRKEFEAAETKAVEAFQALEAMIDSAPKKLLWYIPNAAARVVKVYQLAGKPNEVEEWKTRLAEVETRIQDRAGT